MMKPRCSRRQQCFGDASTMERTPRTAAVEYGELEPGGQGVCCKGQSWRSDSSLWRSLEDCGCIPDIGRLEFDFAFNCDCALMFSPL